MSLSEEMIDRWMANARAAGITLSRDEAEQIAGSGLADRLASLQELFERLEALDRTPDFLGDTAAGEVRDERQ